LTKPCYKYAVIATDIIILAMHQQVLSVLLIKMKKPPYQDCWAAPGGLARLDESVDDSALRNLEGTTGLNNIFLEQLYTFGRVDRDPSGRVVSVAYYALIPDSGISLKTTSNYAGIGWFDVQSMPKLAYDHKNMVDYAVKRLQAKLSYTNVVHNLLPKHFTLTELQTTYEVILRTQFDKRNFRRKIKAADIVVKTDLMTRSRANRPAALYRFKNRTYQTVQIL
jgi:8-oxo-dGTP diphosphatase